MYFNHLSRLALAACLAVGSSAFAAEQEGAPQIVAAAGTEAPSSVVLLKTITTGDGVPLVYPSGTAQVLSRITTFPPHSRTGLHRHPMPLYAYILEGQLTIHTEGQPPRHYKTGDAFMETAAWHYGTNPGDTPTKLLAVYMGEVNLPLSESKAVDSKH